MRGVMRGAMRGAMRGVMRVVMRGVMRSVMRGARRDVRRAAALAIAVALCGAAAPVAADRSYTRPARLAYLARALRSVRELGAELVALDDGLHTDARRRCRAEVAEPSVACLIAAARARCDGGPSARRPACHLAADVAVTNLLAESELVDEATRMRLVNSGGDYRGAMRVELARRRAGLVADLALSQPGSEADLPARIDRFCASRDRDLAWQRCAAAVVWYIGGYPATGDAP
jgi:hypothetical protein